MWRWRRRRITRDMVLFTVGLAGIAYETLVSKTDRPTLLLLFAGMIGLPAFLARDEHERGRHEQPKEPEE